MWLNIWSTDFTLIQKAAKGITQVETLKNINDTKNDNDTLNVQNNYECGWLIKSTLTSHLLYDCCNRKVWIGGNSYDDSNDDYTSKNDDNSTDHDKKLTDDRTALDIDYDHDYNGKTNSLKRLISDTSEANEINTRNTKSSKVKFVPKNDEKKNASINVKSHESLKSVKSDKFDTDFSHGKLMNIVYKSKKKMYDPHLDSDNDTLSTTTTLANLKNNSVKSENSYKRNNINSNNEIVVKSKKSLNDAKNLNNASNPFDGQKTSFKNSLTVADRKNNFDQFLLCGECRTTDSDDEQNDNNERKRGRKRISNDKKVTEIIIDELELLRCSYGCGADIPAWEMPSHLGDRCGNKFASSDLSLSLNNSHIHFHFDDRSSF